jgi:DNA-binding XRE family transcriptional regulator
MALTRVRIQQSRQTRGDIHLSDQIQTSEQVQRAFGQRIRNLRRNKGLSQKAMSELSGVNQNSFRQIERGELDVPLSTLAAIAEVFKISISRLFQDIA